MNKEGDTLTIQQALSESNISALVEPLPSTPTHGWYFIAVPVSDNKLLEANSIPPIIASAGYAPHTKNGVGYMCYLVTLTSNISKFESHADRAYRITADEIIRRGDG